VSRRAKADGADDSDGSADEPPHVSADRVSSS
jgi:hypothetical protein